MGRTIYATDEERTAARKAQQKAALKKYAQSPKGRLKKKELRRARDISHAEVQELLDYDPLTGAFRWRVDRKRNAKAGDVAGSVGSGGYRTITIRCMEFKAHRLAWFYVHGVWPEDKIDHISQDTSDNSIANLRECSHRENIRNIERKGYSFNQSRDRPKQYQALIKVGLKMKHLGFFSTAEEARAAYLAATLRYFGEFSVLSRESEIAKRKGDTHL